MHLLKRLKKSAEHRKKVLQKRQSLQEKKAAVPFDDLLEDTSEGKRTSHSQLVNFISKFGDKGLQNIYNKQQLERISLAYGIKLPSRANKTTFASNLISAVQASSEMPHPCFVDNLRVEARADDHSQRVVLRISRLSQTN